MRWIRLLIVGGTGLLVAGAVAVFVVRSLAPAPAAPVDYIALEREQIRLESERKAAMIEEAERLDSYARNRAFWDNVAGVASIVIPAILLGLPAGLGLAGIDYYWKRREPLIWPRQGDKVLPIPRVNLVDDVHSDLALEALDASHTTARVIGRAFPNVPQTLTLTNSTMPALESGEEEEDEEGIATPPEELPGPFEMSALLASGWRPSLDNIIQGVGIGRRVVADKLPNLLHMALTGETNKGKSNMVRFFLAQILYAGVDAYLLDTHYTDQDVISGDDWRPIRRRLVGQRAISDEREIYDLIRNLQGEIKRRLKLRELGRHPGPPVFYVIEELPSISKRYPDFMEHLGVALREGRKVQIYIIIASQTLLINTIGGDSGIRSQFQTRIYAGGDAGTYSALFPKCKLPEPDQLGVVILKSAKTGQPINVRVPYVANDTLWNLLAPDQRPVTVVPQPVRPALTLLPGPVPAAKIEEETQPLPAPQVESVDAPISFDWAKDEAKRQEWLKNNALDPQDAARALQFYLAGIEPARIVLELKSVPSTAGVKYQAWLAVVNEAIRQELFKRGVPRYVIATGDPPPEAASTGGRQMGAEADDSRVEILDH